MKEKEGGKLRGHIFLYAKKALIALGVVNSMNRQQVKDLLQTKEADHDAHRYTDKERRGDSEGKLRCGLAWARHFFLERGGVVDWPKGKGGRVPPKDRIGEIDEGLMGGFGQYLTEKSLESGFKDVASLALYALGVRKEASPDEVQERLLRLSSDRSLPIFTWDERGHWTTDLAMRTALTHLIDSAQRI